jgi:hypothetical protein
VERLVGRKITKEKKVILVKFIGDGDGVVDTPELHLCGIGPDYTLCGLTLDGDTQTAGSYEMVSASAVTCPECAAVIKLCRGVKIKTPNAGAEPREASASGNLLYDTRKNT